jgi:hypothetical protein
MCRHSWMTLIFQGLKSTFFFCFLTLFFAFTFNASAEPAGPSGSLLAEDSAPTPFHIATVDKRTDFPVQWVAAGGGILASGAGQHADFAIEGEPFSPISHLSFNGVISEALILGKYALLSEEGLGLRIIDLSVPSNPVDLGFYPLSGRIFHLASWGNLLFVAGVDPGIHIFELSFSNEQSPPLILTGREVIPVDDLVMALTASEWKIYAATRREIKVYAVSDPSMALEMESLPIALPVRSMAINGNSLFIAAGAEGLHVVDLSVPGNGGSLAVHPEQSESLYLAGRLVYLASGIDGIHLLKAGPIAATNFQVQVAPNSSLTFFPSPININTGDTVTWVWVTKGGHSSTSGTNCTPNGIWDSQVLDEGSLFQHTFNSAGSFPYFSSGSNGNDCLLGMVGTVNAGVIINISVTPASVNFGNINVGQSSNQSVTITNQTTSTAALTGNVGTLTSPFSVVNGGGAFNLAPGQSMTVSVQFSPTTAGPASTNLSMTHNATNQPSPTSIPLNGTGVAAGPVINISVTPAAVAFGNVTIGQFLDQNITITNQASSTTALNGSLSTLSAPFSVQSGGGAFSLAPGQSMPITVRFSPSAAGAGIENLSITHNATNQASPTNIPLTGTGAAPGGPNVVISFISGPITGKPGGRIAIQNTATNQGDQKASVVTVNFYLSADTQIDTSDTFIGKRTIRNLAPGASSGPVSTMVTLPRNITQGSYFIGAMVGINTNFDPNGIAICPSLSKPKLLSPQNRGTNISATPTLTWFNVAGASSYEVQVATDSGFTNIVASATGLTGSQWTVVPALAGGATYFWRSRAVNPCGAGPWSAAWNFKTA